MDFLSAFCFQTAIRRSTVTWAKPYRLTIPRPRADKLPFVCHLNFVAKQYEMGDIVQVNKFLNNLLLRCLLTSTRFSCFFVLLNNFDSFALLNYFDTQVRNYFDMSVVVLWHLCPVELLRQPNFLPFSFRRYSLNIHSRGQI